MAGFRKWTDLSKASEVGLKLAKLLFDNQDKINAEEWDMYIAGVERDHKTTYDPESRLEIFQHVFVKVEGHESDFMDYRLNIRRSGAATS